MSRADVIKRIEKILGVKKVGLGKREIMAQLEEGDEVGKDGTRMLESVKEDPHGENNVLATPK